MTYDGVIEKPELNEDLLMHYGVPGMKWGVRKEVERVGRKIGSKALQIREKKIAKGKWSGAKEGSRKAKKYNKKLRKLTKSKKFRTETNATKAGSQILKNSGKAAVGSAVAVAAITMSSAALSKYIFSSFGAGDMFKAVSPSARSVTKTILKDAALAAVTVGAIDTYRYSKYGKIRTKKSKENKGL